MSDKSTKDTSKPKPNNQNAKQNPKQNQNNNTNQTKPSKQEQKTTNDITPPKQEQPSQPATPATSTPQPAQQVQPQQPPKPVVTKEKGRGNVKAVLSGDTIIVVHLDKNQQGPPLEREITISNISAPKLGRRKTQKNEATQDQPFAWASREFLRQLTIGKQVTYTIEYKAPGTQDKRAKEYGVVYLVGKGSEQESLAKIITSKGWCTVRRPNSDKEPREDVAELIQLEEDAKRSGIGIFDKTLTSDDTIRPTTEINTTEFFEKHRGKPLSGVVEQVITGNNLRLTLLPSYLNTTLYLSGIECPPENEPFSREAKFLSEYFVLNRDVSVILEGVDKYNLFGSVSFQGKNLGEQLLAAGLARYVDWSGAKTAFQEQLRKAEKAAREGKLRVWSLAAPAQINNNAKTEAKGKLKSGREVVGKVVRVIHGTAIRVKEASGAEHEIYFSSIKLGLPKSQDKDTKSQQEKIREAAIDKSLAWEAKEYVRRRIIGQKVRCVVDYVKELPARDNEPAVERAFFSVYLDKNNIGVELVDHGLATAINHIGPQPRSRDYEHIIFAEQRAKLNKKGVYAPADKAVIIKINDLSSSKDSGNRKKTEGSDDRVDIVNKAKQFLPFLKKAGKQRGVVEHVASATRLRLYIPKESCIVNFSLSGINVPRYSEENPEEFAEEAFSFIVDRVQQRDVEFEVITQGRTGTFIGNIWVNKENLAALLLAEGLATINKNALKENPYVANEFVIAEDSAKKGKLRKWKNYDPEQEEAERKKRNEEENERRKPKQELIDIVVTEIIDATRFYVQISQPEAALKLEALMQKLAAADDSPAYKPKVGELVKAQFTADDVWYRAEVISAVDGQFEVQYVDYGNSELIPESRIRKLDNSLGFGHLVRQAYEAQLAYIIPPGINDEYGGEAADLFRDLVWGKNLVANIERREKTGEKDNVKENLQLMIVDNKDGVLVNGVMLREGLARLDRIVEKKARSGEDKVAQSLKMEEDLARSDHLFLWEYGDPGFDDPDEEPRKKK